jgi:hypothetical protein
LARSDGLAADQCEINSSTSRFGMGRFYTKKGLAVSTIRPGAKTGDIDSGDVGSTFIN